MICLRIETEQSVPLAISVPVFGLSDGLRQKPHRARGVIERLAAFDQSICGRVGHVARERSFLRGQFLSACTQVRGGCKEPVDSGWQKPR